MKVYHLYFLALTFIFSCSHPSQKEVASVSEKTFTFESSVISDSGNLWWARTLADINGDGILDVVLINNNGSGGWLGYLTGQLEPGKWKQMIVAETAPNGETFASGDLEVADMDGDGDIDLLAVAHPGEWDNGSAPATLYWYEQDGQEWIPHLVGTTPSFPKDISIGDLDGDGFLEVITATFDAATLSVFSMRANSWDLPVNNLHEGMGIGDVDGDGQIDIIANGYYFQNPGSLEKPWSPAAIDTLWHSQNEVHWSRNATKIAVKDVDRDGKAEVFITHSEKGGYPLCRYDWGGESWQKSIILNEIPAAHNLAIEDIDQDGQFEIITGVNRSRAIDIAKENDVEVPTTFPVMILTQASSTWQIDTINMDGSYNLLVGDWEGDGDVDIFRMTSHDTKELWLMKNLTLD